MFDAAMDVLPVTKPMTVHKLSVAVKGRVLSAEIRIPKVTTPGLPPLVALHGISRKAKSIADAFSIPCDAKGQILITPHFSRKQWRHFQQIGTYRPDRAILTLLDLVQQMGFASTEQVDIFGYSGGAQLAHRFAMLYPQRVAKLHLAAAGWYCLPDLKQAFPMGLAPSTKRLRANVPALAHNQLRNYLDLKLRVYVGAEDRHRDDALRKNPEVDDVQGRHRLARARHYCDAFRIAATARGITPDLTLTEIPNCVHSFSDCARAGLTTLVCNS
ncbi:alpha/beta hydrolase [Ruegeria sp. 2205SS24-7]|uniref:alpha/beta fold hydrolase n=1 Tax=Ruegeria discodermiae TaxID=3064389 RepID=UPI0027406E9F|nr:alpha/beta hydrolase [Ruegeria sp. 2205SS24-7]MDP5217297.1 alpha/beta hydrolase [Ruegeria sp. 2205SS24-7]